MAPVVVFVEGNIGIGKSTLLASLKASLLADAATPPRVVFLDEPVSIWEESGLLRAMYSGDVTKCLFQQQALATRFAPFMMALTTPGVQLVVAERSIYSDRGIFVATQVKNPLELAAYATEHDALTQLLPADQRFSTVMLDAPLATLAARVSKRDRASEVETAAAATADDEVAVAPPYLAALAAAHDEYYAAVAHPKRRVAADGAPAEVAAAVLAAIADLVGECGGVKSLISPIVEVQYLDFMLEGNAAYEHALPATFETCIVHVYRGDGVFGADKKAATEGTCLLFGPGDSVTFTAGSASGCDFLLLAGVPLREPCVWHGPSTDADC